MNIPLKLPQINRSFLMLGGALLLGGVALALSNKLLSDRLHQIDEEARAGHTMVKVVVANRDVARGEPIGADNFAVRELPAEYLHASAVRPEQFPELAGQRMGAPLKRGEPLLDVHMEYQSGVLIDAVEGQSGLDHGGRRGQFDLGNAAAVRSHRPDRDRTWKQQHDRNHVSLDVERRSAGHRPSHAQAGRQFRAAHLHHDHAIG